MTTKEKIVSNTLLMTKDERFEKIQMIDIADSVNISRQGLYKNFSSKEEIIKYGLTNKLIQIVNHLKTLENINDKVCEFYNICFENKDYIKIYFRDDLYLMTIDIFAKFLKDVFYKMLKKKNVSDVEVDINITIFITLMRNVIKSDFDITLEEYLNILRKYYGKF